MEFEQCWSSGVLSSPSTQLDSRYDAIDAVGWRSQKQEIGEQRSDRKAIEKVGLDEYRYEQMNRFDFGSHWRLESARPRGSKSRLKMVISQRESSRAGTSVNSRP